MVCRMSSTRVGIYIEGLGMKFVIFCKFFFEFFGLQTVKTASCNGGPIRSRHVEQSDRATSLSPALSPRQCVALALASLSPGRALQRGRERGDTAHSRWTQAPSPGDPLSPASRPRAGGSGSLPRYRPRCLAKCFRQYHHCIIVPTKYK
jgi:hypothetical protein